MEDVAMSADDFPNVANTNQGRAYRGSLFAEMRQTLFANPTNGCGRRAAAADGEDVVCQRASGPAAIRAPLPDPGSDRARGRCQKRHALGAGRKSYRRLLHRKGMCLIGAGEITEPTGYSRYFRQRSRALLIARYSTCCR
jgi:hypothetical protein